MHVCLPTGAWVLLLVNICLLQQLPAAAAQAAFLQQQLPLRVLVTTPTALSTHSNASSAIGLTGRQALTRFLQSCSYHGSSTCLQQPCNDPWFAFNIYFIILQAVFSRPVIALGSDWGSKVLPANLVPFTLSCGMPGRLRWVTTNIARFDPLVEWPSDLACSFNWNKGLKSFDGAPLVLGSISASVPLATQPLVMDVASVVSKAADSATDGLWGALIGLPDDKLPEVPPDGNITLSFSYPVELSKLASALRLVGSGASGRAVNISPCMSATPPILWPLVFAADGQPRAGSSPDNGSSADLLKVNSTCAVVKIVPGLEAGASATLRLPAGARYSSIAGPVSKDTDKQVYGLRSFRIPLTPDFQNVTNTSQIVYNGVRYRRLVMWLPHGLAADTRLSELQPLIEICAFASAFDQGSACKDLEFELSRPNKGTLQAAVPALSPKQRYRVTVTADAKIKDAFGLPLQSSVNTWWTMELEAAYQGPNLNQKGLDKVQAWDVAVPAGPAASAANSDMARAVAALNYGYSGLASTAFGDPDASVSRPSSPAPTFQALPLSGKPGISFVGSCCREVTWPTARNVFASNLLVAQSNLQAAFVGQAGKLVAWVTSSQGASEPVAGAKVQVYLSRYSEDLASLGPSCTTSAEGICTLDVSTNSYDSSTQSAVITAPGEGPLVVPSLPSGYSSNAGAYAASIVLDRQLVKPGDDLHLTDNTHITAAVNTTFGSVHATLPVPKGASPAGYTVQLFTVRTATPSRPNAVVMAAPAAGSARGAAGDLLASASFTVGDPRPPTATLSIDAPAWVKPTDSVTVKLTAASYIGSDVSDADITLEWETAKAKGSVTSKTNAQGVATALVALGKLPAANRSEQGDSMSCRIADGPVRVELQRSLLTDVPGIRFGVKADAFSNDDDSPVKGATVQLPAAHLLSQQRCSIPAGDVRAATECQLSVPCMGDFTLKGCVNGSCSAPIKIGRNASWWSASPWAAPPQLNLLPDRQNVTVGGALNLVVQNPWWGPTSGLLVWGNAVKREVRVLPQIPPGPSTIAINGLGEECRGTCRFALLMAVARPSQPAAASAAAQMNTFAGHLAVQQAVQLAVQLALSEGLAVAVALEGQAKTAEGLAVLTPKHQAEVLVVLRCGCRVAGLSQGVRQGCCRRLVPGAEVTLLVVDKAILDLMPYELQNVSSAMAPDLSTYFSLTDLNALRTSRAAINATFAALRRRLSALDPWLPVDTQVTPGGFYPLASDESMPMPQQTAAVDVPDAAYLAGYKTPITVLPYLTCSWGLPCPVPFNPRSFGLAAESVASDGAAMPAAAPMMAKSTAATNNAATRSVVAAAPRPGSGGGAGAPPAAAPGAALRLQEAFRVTALFKVVTAGADGSVTVNFRRRRAWAQQEARFDFSAQGLGSQSIRFVATAGEDAEVADQVQLDVPVLGKQGPVWIATSFAVRGSNSSTIANRVEGLALPRAENGSGSVSLVAGVGYLPAIQGSYEALVRQGVASLRDCPSGTSAIALSYLTPYQLNATQQALQIAVKPLTDATYGLLPVDSGCLWPFSSGPSRADINLNAWATWLVEQLASPPAASPAAAAGQASKARSNAVNAASFTGADEVSVSWAALVSASKTWRKALEAQLVADAVAARAAQPPVAYRDLGALSWARLVLGATWEPAGVAQSVQQDLSMSRLVVAAANMSVGAQARVGLTLLAAGNSSSSSEVGAIAGRLLSNARVGGRTAYIATGDGERGAAALSDQSLALMLFVRSGTNNPLIQKIAAWRVVQLASADGGDLAAVGLGKLVTVAVQITSPDDQSDVLVEVLMPGGLEPLDPNVYKDTDLATSCSSSEDESDLSAPRSSSNSRGLAMGRPFAVASVAAAPAYSGKVGTAMVQLASPGGMGSGGSSSPYRPLPWWRPWPVCPVQTTSPASVLFSFSYFRAGTQTLRFKAVAATSGVFTLPPVKAYLQQQPEVMGLSPAGTFTVCPTAQTCAAAQQQPGTAAVAKACPQDCSGNGACNLASGACICDAGFSGPDCGAFGSSSSIIFATRAHANKQGWRDYRQWLASNQQQQQKGASPSPTLQRASPAAELRTTCHLLSWATSALHQGRFWRGAQAGKCSATTSMTHALPHASPAAHARRVQTDDSMRASPHIVDAFVAGSIVASQRIVRAAALALRDLHDMTGHIHCEMKTNNLLVFGGAAHPAIKLCDLGVAKRHAAAPRTGPSRAPRNGRTLV
ncbi:hypothetical protein COO60DRAFT_1458856 [Scenedesmus sp. NREL 46B-D3]|nr:hypothetical protein COO60DRAFT_1458856 [Scenedesmus sp. NREL 46B-D3]